MIGKEEPRNDCQAIRGIYNTDIAELKPDATNGQDPFALEAGIINGILEANSDDAFSIACDPFDEDIENFSSGPDEQNNQPDDKKFRLIPAHEVMKNIKPVEWLVEDLIERNSFAEIFGESGTYKSFLALDIALCVATGTFFHGRPVTQGAVVIVIGEGLNGYGRRLAAWQKHHGIDLSDSPIFVSSIAAQFLENDSAAEVENAIASVKEIHGKVELVLIDTLNRNFGPGDENGSKDMTKFIAALDSRIGSDVTRLIIHHTGHSNKDRARGSYVLPAALDCEIQVSKKDGLITLINNKQKDAPEFSPINFTPEIINLDESDNAGLLNPVTSVVLKEISDKSTAGKLRPNQQLVHDILSSTPGTSCSKKGILEMLHLSKTYLSSTGNQDAERKALDRTLCDLVNDGYINKIDKDCYTIIQEDNRDMSWTN